MKRSAATNTVNRSSPVPLYHQIATHIREDLLNNDFQPGAQYHSDREVVRLYGVSLMTARQAVSQLVLDRLLERRRGSGTFVSSHVKALREKSVRPAPALLFTGWMPNDLTNYEAMYFRDVYDGICQEAKQQKYHMLFDDLRGTTPDDIAAEIKSRNIRGVLALVGNTTSQRIAQLQKGGLRIVTINFNVPQCPAIMPNDYGGARLAVRHLLQLEHSNVVHINSGESTPHWVDVKRGYLDEIAANKLVPRVMDSTLKRGTIEAGYGLIEGLLKLKDRPTAIFAGNDFMSIGAMKALSATGVQVPKDISVIGFDNIEAAEICTPALTTIAVDRQAIGRTAVRVVLDEKIVAPAIQRIDTLLVERHSTAQRRNA